MMLVGHDALLAQLTEYAVRGVPVVLTGPPGIGRTALLDRALADAAAAGRTVARLAGMPGDHDTPYAALCPLLAGLPYDGLPVAQREAVEAVLRRRTGAPDPLALRLAVAALVPGLLGVDDLHWLDPPTAELVGFLVAAG
ncbi:MAG: AAA family ATPase, partial [Micromonosporaceae bacterium]